MTRVLRGRWTCSFVWLGLVLLIALGLHAGAGLEAFAAMRVSVSLIMLGLLVMLLKHGQESREKLEAVLLADRREREDIARDLSMRTSALEQRAADLAALLADDTAARSERVDQNFATLTEKLDENTRVSSAAADASHQAEAAAIDVNAKIQDTNDRVTELAQQILDAIKRAKRK